ncbi:MAG: hypothetical protein CTY31_14175 [Hyphomicrobium sp.]|nr:MAG: hypothetical protein CTY31_14175 [Hyphomicrobium sp.]
MADTRKPFLSFASDIDDTAIEAMARSKGVPALTRPDNPSVRERVSPIDQTAGSQDDCGVSDLETGLTPRSRMSYVKACLPDYALLELKTRAARERVSVNHILMKALTLAGIPIRPEDMIEDGRRLRGKSISHLHST